MVKTRIILLIVSALLIWAIFLLPKVVVESERGLATDSTARDAGNQEIHPPAPENVRKSIARLRASHQAVIGKEKSAIFADSLASLYSRAGKFDSAAWFAGEATTFFNTPESWVKAGDQYYQAYTFTVDKARQNEYADKARDFYEKVLEGNPKNLNVKAKLAMTYLNTNVMQGVKLLREVLQDDPKNEEALFNLGMLSIQSGQYDLAVKRLGELVKVNPSNVQAQLLLGIALMNTGDKEGARQQFEKVKQMDKDPSVQSTVDSYLKDLK